MNSENDPISGLLESIFRNSMKIIYNYGFILYRFSAKPVTDTVNLENQFTKRKHCVLVISDN